MFFGFIFVFVVNAFCQFGDSNGYEDDYYYLQRRWEWRGGCGGFLGGLRGGEGVGGGSVVAGLGCGDYGVGILIGGEGGVGGVGVGGDVGVGGGGAAGGGAGGGA